MKILLLISKRILFLLFPVLAINLYAQDRVPADDAGKINSHISSLWKREPFGSYDINKEIVDRRDAVSKHFKGENGEITAHISSGQLHYFDAGQWKTIFHTIEPNQGGQFPGYTFANIHNSTKTFYSGYADGAGIKTVLQSGTEISDLKNLKAYFQVAGESHGTLHAQHVPGTADFNTLLYPAAFGQHIDMEIQQHTTMRKLNYIIQDRTALSAAPAGTDFMVFEETIELPAGWKAELAGKVILLKSADGKVQALYEKPDFYEQNPAKTENIRRKVKITGDYEISQSGNMLTVKTIVDFAWLSDSDRQFPVVIDPTFNYVPDIATLWTVVLETARSPSGIDYTAITGNAFSAAFYGAYDDLLALGGDVYNYSGTAYDRQIFHSYAKFNTTAIPDGSTISSSVLNTNVYYDNASRVSAFIRPIAADPVTGTWASRLADARDGVAYNDIPWNATVNFSSTGTKTFALGGTANADLQANLVNNWFAVGYNTYYIYYTDDFIEAYGTSSVYCPWITVTYNSCVPPAATMDWGDGSVKQWMVHGINSDVTFSANDYRGNYSFNASSGNEGSINTETYWSQLNAPSSAGTTVNSGNKWNGCAMNTDYFMISHRRRGFPCGFYQIVMQLSDDGTEILVDGISRWSGTNYKNAGGQTCGTGCNTHVGYFYLDGNSTVEVKTSDATSDAYLKMDILPVTSGISYSAGSTDHVNQSWCVGNTASTMTSTAIPSVTISGLPAIVPSGVWTYQWQSNTTGCGGAWANISGQTGASLSPGVMMQSNYYRRNAFLPCSGTILASTPCASVVTPVPNTSLSGNNRTASCIVNDGNWIHFYDVSDNRLVVSINSNGNNLGNVTATSYVGAPVSVQDCGSSNPIYASTVMGRNWVITPQFQPASPVSIRLPFDNSTEMGALATAANSNANPLDNIAGMGSLRLSKYSGPANVDGVAWNNCASAGGSGGTTVHAQTAAGEVNTYLSGFTGDVKYLQFSVNGFSEFWLHGSSNNSPLPVELTSFTATCAQDGSVALDWSTASEYNSQKFTVEKSRNLDQWQFVSELPAAGNTNYHTAYTTTDEGSGGIVYYRLVQTDNDGAEKIYGPVSVLCGADENGIHVFPNPSSGAFTVEVTSVENIENADIRITDLAGKIVSTRTLNLLEGKNQLLFDGTELQMGTYIIQLSTRDNGFQPARIVIN